MTAALVAVDPDGLARRTRLARDIGEALAKLAVHASPTDVALALQGSGFEGRPCLSTTCPIARYVNAAVGLTEDDEVVAVGPRDWGVGYSAGPWSSNVTIEQDLPPVLSKFVRRFDSGAYPELMDER